MTRPPFRAEHVGSLLRPPEVLKARAALLDGRLDAAGLRAVEDEAIRAAVRRQEEIGLKGVTDGEFRRGSWHMDFLYRVGGVTKTMDNLVVRFENEKGGVEFTPASHRVTGRLHHAAPIMRCDFAFLKSVARATPKVTIPSPSMMHYRGGRAAIDAAVYPDLDRFYDDLGDAYAAEIADLGAAGLTYLQLDDVSLAYLNDPKQREHIRAVGGDADRQHEIYARLINRAVAKRPPGMRIVAHLCRGNFRSSWVASGGYDHVAETIFNRIDIDGFFLEYDDARSGGFEPLRFVPKGKHIVLGLVTSKRGALEDRDALKRRIEAAAKYVPLDQLSLSPQCGFSSTVDGNALSADEQWRKLELAVATALDVWGET